MNFSRRVQGFLFPADSGRYLTILRVGVGLELWLFLFSLGRDWNRLFGSQTEGLFDRAVGDAMTTVQSPILPRIGWFVWLFRQLGGSERLALSAVWWCLLGVSFLLILGLFTRPMAILAWFLQLACAKSGGLFSYGADNFITMGLFYLMIAPPPDRWSLDCIWRSRCAGDFYSLGFQRRVLQLHLCLIYFFSGLTKSLGAGWWNGSNLWRALTTPPFDLWPPRWIAAGGMLLPAAGIFVCLLETGYPFLIWWRRSRKVALGAVCAMHLAIGLLMGMYLFAGALLVLNLSAFLPNEQRTAAPS